MLLEQLDVHMQNKQKQKANQKTLSYYLTQLTKINPKWILDPQIQEAEQILNTINPKKAIPRHIIIKLLKIKTKIISS